MTAGELELEQRNVLGHSKAPGDGDVSGATQYASCRAGAGKRAAEPLSRRTNPFPTPKITDRRYAVPARIDRRDGRPRSSSAGKSWLYVLPCRHEDILKVGFSRQPLRRLRALHPRYFEFFDLERAFLIEADTVKDARGLERHMASSVKLHRAPSPLVVTRAAAGHTEWYRGAYEILRQEAETLGGEGGYRVEAPLQTWLAAQLRGSADLLYDWSQRMLDGIAIEIASLDSDAFRPTPLERTLRNALDAHAAADLPIESLVAGGVIDWYRDNHQRFPLG